MAFKLDVLKLEVLERAWRNFLRAGVSMGNKVSESFIVINNYRIIIINAYYKYIINARYNCYVCNEVFLEEQENVAVTGAAAAATSYCFERTFQNILSNVTYSLGHHQADTPMINIQLTFRTAPICVKIFHCSIIW